MIKYKLENIYFEKNGIIKLNNYIKKIKPSKLIFLTDENSNKLCYPSIKKKLEQKNNIKIIKIKSGEKNKNIKTCKKIWSILIDNEIDRNSLMINLGGGVITDMGGFIASTYMRGIKFINIPTTLLAMIDASVGGKNGIDFNFIKNLIGVFAFPEIVLINSQFLTTLSQNQLRSGFAEMLKHALIFDRKHWDVLKEINYFDINNLKNQINHNVKIKFDIVKKDFNEKTIRKILNFGHTIGHALESLFLYKKQPILHGEAIAIGMLTESYISYKEDILSKNDFLEIEKYILSIFPLYNFNKKDFNFLLNVIKKDKKNKSSKILFSLINSIGHGIINQDIKCNKILNSFEYLLNLM